jgi:Protein of unknown function (DUF2845)
MMTKVVSATLLLAIASFAVHAETLRCGSSLVSEGATEGFVLEKCGQPETKREITEPVMARGLNGNMYQTGTTTREIWRYKRSQGSFPAILTFEGGVLKKLEFEK